MTIVLAGCTSEHEDTVPLPPKPTEMAVTMVEYRFEHLEEMPAGRVIFRVHNGGQLDHKLEMVALEDDFEGTLDDQLRADVRVAATGLASIRRQTPGNDQVFAMDLPPGKYGFLCFVEVPEGGTHALRGMSSEFVLR